MNKKIIINEQCIGCGLCLDNTFIEETMDGKAKASGAGVLSSEQIEQACEAAEQCPANAIIIQEISAKSKEEIGKILDSKPESLKLSVPPKSNFKFDASKVDIPIPNNTGHEYDYRYSNYKQAIDAAKEVIRKNMFGNRIGIVQDIIGSYLTENFSSYVDYKESESNFFYSANNQAQKILNIMVGEVQGANPDISIPENLKTISTRPTHKKDDLGVGALTGGLLNTASYIIDELSDSCYSLQSYAEDADWDEMDTYTTGAFGREKVVTKYCYKGIYDAYRSIAKDIRSALGWSFEENVVNHAYDSMQYIIGQYEKKLISELKEKAGQLKGLL